ncbi:uncharacterized protein LOC129747458 [Uranotaenia lowii]|uniref:uncharacterized protein LOC129747458 n=1 Tax=Uranotaenia lowii TaxID=190385 RepID=UPI00247A96BC|nr:uncharacterized protein LOC129747458 [Uranotaenia lowii]
MHTKLLTVILCWSLRLSFAVLVSGRAASVPDEEQPCSGGVCVPFYLCPNGSLVESGEGLIDVRLGGAECPLNMVCCAEQGTHIGNCPGTCSARDKCAQAFDGNATSCTSGQICCLKISETTGATVNKPSGQCQGECIESIVCANRTIIGTDLIDLRFSNDGCEGNLICCETGGASKEVSGKSSECKGHCVPFGRCDRKVSKTTGKGLIDLRSIDNSCPGDLICCEPEEELNSSCQCVPLYLCLDEFNIDVRAIENGCAEDQLCCEKVRPINQFTEISSTTCRGSCVPAQQCSRQGPEKDLIELRTQDACPEDLVCCDVITKPIISVVEKCEGECVSIERCPGNKISDNGTGLFDLRIGDDSCPNELVCCKTPLKDVKTEQGDNCKCLMFNQCADSTSSFDLRSSSSQCQTNQVCCVNVIDIPEPPIFKPKVCEGRCVPFNQCVDTNHNGLIDLRGLEDPCPGNFVCCKGSASPTLTTKCKGSCVPADRCQSVQKDLIDLRTSDDCPGELICCEFPSTSKPVSVLPMMIMNIQNIKSETCPGNCLPFGQCPKDLLYSSGSFFDLRIVDDVCPRNFVCCLNNVATIPTFPQSLDKICQCVPLNRCADPDNSFDLRLNSNKCPSDQVCCEIVFQNAVLPFNKACKGTCVPFSQCKNPVGMDLFDLRSTDMCPDDLVCCDYSDMISIIPPAITVTDELQKACPGKCISSTQCPIGSIISTAVDSIDLRNSGELCAAGQICCMETPFNFDDCQCVLSNKCLDNEATYPVFDLRLENRKCLFNEVCCKNRVEVPNLFPTKSCRHICVPPDQCQDRSGKNIIDLRSLDQCLDGLVCCEPNDLISSITTIPSVINIPSVCPGSCVPYDSCPNGRPKSAGNGLLGFRTFENACPEGLTCCAETPKVSHTTCKCTPISRCADRNTFDLRFDHCPEFQTCCVEVIEKESTCLGTCAPIGQCNSIDLRFDNSNGVCPGGFICCGNTSTVPSSKESWTQWINNINNMKESKAENAPCRLNINPATSEINEGEIPWLATVWRKNIAPGGQPNEFLCTGSLVQESVVLVPADCIVNIPPESITVTLAPYGSNINDREYEYKISKHIIHPDYNESRNYANVGLLMLNKSSKTRDAATACLFGYDESISDDECYLAGWSSSALIASPSARPLKYKLTVNSRPSSSCGSNFLCPTIQQRLAGASMANCDDLRGSPLICLDASRRHWKLAGLAGKNNRNCNAQSIPESLINVGPHRMWILEQISPSFVQKKESYLVPSRQYLPSI